MNELLARDIEIIKENLLEFTEKSVAKFLKNHENLVFYAFGYDCNVEYGEVCLCFNTEEAFEKTLASYQKGPYGKRYEGEAGIFDVRYNTGDWDYQCFDTLYVLTEEELTPIFNADVDDVTYNESLNGFMDLFCEILLDFSVTPTFETIPKTEDFKLICLDHDEGVMESDERMARLISRKPKQ